MECHAKRHFKYVDFGRASLPEGHAYRTLLYRTASLPSELFHDVYDSVRVLEVEHDLKVLREEAETLQIRGKRLDLVVEAVRRGALKVCMQEEEEMDYEAGGCEKVEVEEAGEMEKEVEMKLLRGVSYRIRWSRTSSSDWSMKKATTEKPRRRRWWFPWRG
jgi:hypothetical protein